MTNSIQIASLANGHTIKRHERRVSAVDAFIDLVLEHGDAPGPDAVAKRAGVSIASMYRYFETLDELRNDAIIRISERFPDLGLQGRDKSEIYPRYIRDIAEI